MKKRKKPIFLVAVFVLLTGGVIAMNSNLLTMPKTAEDIAKQEEKDAAEAAAKNPPIEAKPAAKPAEEAPGSTVGKDDGSLVSVKDGDMGEGVNIKPKLAVKDGDPLISAPLNLKNKQRRQDRTSVQVQGQWYADESGSNEQHHGK